MRHPHLGFVTTPCLKEFLPILNPSIGPSVFLFIYRHVQSFVEGWSGGGWGRVPRGIPVYRIPPGTRRRSPHPAACIVIWERHHLEGSPELTNNKNEQIYEYV